MPPEKQCNGNSNEKSSLPGSDLALYSTFALKAHSTSIPFIWEGRSTKNRGPGWPLSITVPDDTSKYPSDFRSPSFPCHLHLPPLYAVATLTVHVTS